jgi:hypothetical protein
MIGLQEKASNTNQGKITLKGSFPQSIDHFKEIGTRKLPNREIMERIISNMLFLADDCQLISKKFKDFVFSLGESVAGDEKLFHYTGESSRIRQVPSKPDRIAFGFMNYVER